MPDDLVARERPKRERHLSPAERWRQIQQAIDFASAQLPEPRGSKSVCLRLQAEKLARFRQLSQK